jgi:hypothetical protein
VEPGRCEREQECRPGHPATLEATNAGRG